MAIITNRFKIQEGPSHITLHVFLQGDGVSTDLSNFVLLDPTDDISPAQPAQQSTQPHCTTCGKPMTYIQQYQRWYCYSDKKYV